MNGSRSQVEVYVGRRYAGTLRMSLEESEALLTQLKTAGFKARNKKSPALEGS